MQARYAEDTGVKGLKIRHNNVLGYFVEVTAQHGDRLMAPPLNATFIHRQTLAGQVRFTTSELGEIEARIANAGDRALGLELEIFERLCAMVLDASEDLRAAAHAFALLDVAAALAKLADRPCQPARTPSRRCAEDPRCGWLARCRPARCRGAAPELAGFASWADEGAHLVQRIRGLEAAGVPHEQQAVLVRTNARSADLEEVLHAAGIPFQGASLLGREAARSLLRRLRPARGPAGDVVREAALALGWQPVPAEDLGEREQTRQSDLGRIVAIASELDDVSELAAELERRFGASVATGVHLLTLHRSKGLEWEAVFLPKLDEGELPIRRGDVEEERRLLYVGLTRARRHLSVTWSGKPSRFLAELGVTGRAGKAPAPKRPAVAAAGLSPVGRALRAWRLERSRADGVPAYVVFHDRTLAEIELASPTSIGELAAISGLGPTKIERYGSELLAVLAG